MVLGGPFPFHMKTRLQKPKTCHDLYGMIPTTEKSVWFTDYFHFFLKSTDSKSKQFWNRLFSAKFKLFFKNWILYFICTFLEATTFYKVGFSFYLFSDHGLFQCFSYFYLFFSSFQDCEFLCLLSSFLNKDAYFSFNFVRELVVKDVTNQKLWNIFNAIITSFDDTRHNKFLLR